MQVFNFADKYRGSYNESLGPWVCSFYCDFSGYQVKLLETIKRYNFITKLLYEFKISRR